MQLQASFECIKGTVFLILGILILVYGATYLTFVSWQRHVLGIGLVVYGLYKFYRAVVLWRQR